MSEEIRITAEGAAVVECGLSLRHAHELKTGCSAEALCAECRHAIGEDGPVNLPEGSCGVGND